MNQERSQEFRSELEGTAAELALLRETYDSATEVLKLGRRWLKTKPGPVGSPDGVQFMFSTFQESFIHRLFGFRNRFPESLSRLVLKNRPLSDALQFLELASGRFHSECLCKQGVEAERVANLLGGLEAARDILGEVLDDLEADENPTLRPTWERDDKKLWYGETLCREYARIASEQFQILDEFQVREWPRSVPSPFRDAKKLRDTIGHMNSDHTTESFIRFEVFNGRPAWFRRPRSTMG